MDKSKERNSASSIRKIFVENANNSKFTNDKSLKQQRSSTNKRNSDSSISESLNDESTIGGPLDGNKALTILWYIGTCLLFLIAFLALILTLLYFLTDSSTEQVIKLYGITASGCLAIITFIIICLDCCNDSERDDEEQEAIYRILEIKEKKDKKAVKRHNRRVIIQKEEQAKPSITQQIPKSVPSTGHHHHYTQPSHIHHIHAHVPNFYYHPHSFSFYPYSHGFNHYHHHHHRRHRSDVGVDTSDRLETILKSKGTFHKAVRDAQTDPKVEDVEHGTQTSTMDFDGKFSNISEVVKKTSTPLSILNESIEQLDKDLPNAKLTPESNSITIESV